MRYGKSDGHIPKDWQFILGLQFAFPIAALGMGLFLPIAIRVREGDLTLFWVALAAAIVGIVLLFLAKLPLYRQGRYLTFGPRVLAPGRRRVYRIAYVFIGASLFLILSLLGALE